MIENNLYGDALEMWDSTGGDDTLTSNDGDNALYGDAFYMLGTSTGGNDILISGKGSDTMYGDAVIMDASTKGGNDILNAAKGGGLKVATIYCMATEGLTTL